MIRPPCGLLLLLAAAAPTAASSSSSARPEAPPLAHELDASYAFSDYLAHFSKSYPDPDERARRAEIFARSLEVILSHNEGRIDGEGNILDGGYVMGVNAYTDHDEDELPTGYNKALHPAWRARWSGVRGPAATERMLGGELSYEEPPAFTVDDVASLPDAVDWDARGKVVPAPQQGHCGSCWSFASTATVESHLAIADGGGPVPLSEQEMMVCTPNPRHCGGAGNCTGSTMQIALDRIADRTLKGTGGMYTLEDIPYDARGPWEDCADMTEGKEPYAGITGWTRLESNSYEAVMNALAKVGPLAIAMSATDWKYYEGGVFDTDRTDLNHGILLAGYGVDDGTGEKYWKVRNSWGTSFGEEGYIRIKRADDDGRRCGTDDDPLEGVACALDDRGDAVDAPPVEVCGTGGILFDAVYPVGVHATV